MYSNGVAQKSMRHLNEKQILVLCADVSPVCPTNKSWATHRSPKQHLKTTVALQAAPS